MRYRPSRSFRTPSPESRRAAAERAQLVNPPKAAAKTLTCVGHVVLHIEPQEQLSFLSLPAEIRQSILEETLDDGDLLFDPNVPAWCSNLSLVHRTINRDIFSVHKIWRRRQRELESRSKVDNAALMKDYVALARLDEARLMPVGIRLKQKKLKKPTTFGETRRRQWLASHPEALPPHFQQMNTSLVHAWMKSPAGRKQLRKRFKDNDRAFGQMTKESMFRGKKTVFPE